MDNKSVINSVSSITSANNAVGPSADDKFKLPMNEAEKDFTSVHNEILHK